MVKKNEIAKSGTLDVSAIVKKVEEERTALIEANQGLEIDFVNMGTWLYVNKKGVFYDKEHDIMFSDEIKAIILDGRSAYLVWDNGKAVIRAKTREEAETLLADYLEREQPDEDLSIDERYIITVLLVDDDSNVNLSTPYILSLPVTGKYAFGKYTLNLFRGTASVPAGTPVKSVITTIFTEDKQGRGNTSYIAINFRHDD